MPTSDKSMSPYAPIRYREFPWWQYATHVAKLRFIMANGNIHRDLPDLILKQLIVPTAKLAEDHFLGDGETAQVYTQFIAGLMEYRHWVPLVGQYELNGRQIFDLDDSLVEMLAQTDIGDCTLQDWHPPYDAFFVRFGPQAEIKLPFDNDFEYLDGAFVAVTPWDSSDPARSRIKFGFTMVHKDGSGVAMPGWFMDLNPEEQAMPIIAGFETSIRRRIASFSDGNESDSSQALSACRAAMLEESIDLIRQAVQLVVNAMFYIESLGRHVATEKVEPGRDTPVEQLVAWKQSTPEKRAKLRSRLTSDGYALVHFLGSEFRAAHSLHDTGTGMKAHWRRGHWRMQRKGPNLSQVERKWIKPTMVNPGQAQQDEIPGHIYAVGGLDGNSIH